MHQQPIKFASFEGYWDTRTCAPMAILGWVDESSQKTTALQIPCLGSFLAGFSVDTKLTGLDAFLGKELLPPVNLVFQTYHLMIDLGTAFVGIGLLGVLLYVWKRKVFEFKPALWLFVITAFLTEVSIISGWWTAEVGRQPWIVYKLMKTSEGLSPTLTSPQLWVSFLTFMVLYTILSVLFLYLLFTKIQQGPEPLKDVESVPVSSLPDTFGQVFGRRKAK
jgi:cytochrome d ubiquinol oxidase subunit I